MTNAIERIKSGPPLLRLELDRVQLLWVLSAGILVSCFGFLVLSALLPSVRESTLGQSAVALGAPLGVVMICLAFLLTADYARRVRADLDEFLREMRHD
jgi:uncharacterized membrane protein (DUF485 family)